MKEDLRDYQRCLTDIPEIPDIVKGLRGSAGVDAEGTDGTDVDNLYSIYGFAEYFDLSGKVRSSILAAVSLQHSSSTMGCISDGAQIVDPCLLALPCTSFFYISLYHAIRIVSFPASFRGDVQVEPDSNTCVPTVKTCTSWFVLRIS